MDREKFNKAMQIDNEIDRLDMLMKYVEKGDDDDVLMNPRVNDFAFLVYLIGVENVLSAMGERKRFLEKEFDEL